MKNVTFIGGPLHNIGRILRAQETTYRYFGIVKPAVGSKFVHSGEQVEAKECFYKESFRGSNIFIYVNNA